MMVAIKIDKKFRFKNFKTDNVQDMSEMFSRSIRLRNLDLSSFDITNCDAKCIKYIQKPFLILQQITLLKIID